MTTNLSPEELRAVQVRILAEFDRVCRRHGLVYYLAYGTLLGAVRHGGFIPWDDDIDVMMPRADYDRLLGLFDSAAPLDLSLGSPQTQDDWPFPYAKVSDDRTELWEPLEVPLPLGVNIDVFPIDVLPASRVTRAVQARLLRLLRWAVELKYIATERGRAWHSPIAISVGKPLLRRVPMRFLIRSFTRAASSGSHPSDRAGVRVGSFDWSAPVSDLGTPTKLRFEDLTLPGPADPAAVLTKIYGDYGTLPPQAEQISHHGFTASWRTSG
ncbi:MAG: LicD family protein [Propionibacteriaceae bacterium]